MCAHTTTRTTTDCCSYSCAASSCGGCEHHLPGEMECLPRSMYHVQVYLCMYVCGKSRRRQPQPTIMRVLTCTVNKGSERSRAACRKHPTSFLRISVMVIKEHPPRPGVRCRRLLSAFSLTHTYAKQYRTYEVFVMLNYRQYRMYVYNNTSPS